MMRNTCTVFMSIIHVYSVHYSHARYTDKSTENRKGILDSFPTYIWHFKCLVNEYLILNPRHLVQIIIDF